jgi:hypothetical protein
MTTFNFGLPDVPKSERLNSLTRGRVKVVYSGYMDVDILGQADATASNAI